MPSDVVLSHNSADLLQTTFTMLVGETVVVGTSRVQGGKALVVLLTIVEAGK